MSEPHKTLVKRKIELLKDFSKNMPNIKALQGEYKGLYRLRAGDFRIIFDVVDKTTIIILNVFARKDEY